MARTPEPTRDTAADDCLSTALRQATRRLGAVYDAAMAPLGVNGTQARLLWKIGALQEEGGAPLKRVAEEMGYQVSALSHALKPLERDGLVQVTQSRADRRMRHLELTGKGRGVVSQITDRWLAANARIDTALGRAEAEALMRLASKVAGPDFARAMERGEKG